MIELGGNKIDELIVEVVKKRYNIYIGLKTAEKIKINLTFISNLPVLQPPKVLRCPIVEVRADM